MNNKRRKELRCVSNSLNNILSHNDMDVEKILEVLSESKHELEAILFDEEYYMDSIPENLQNSSRYEIAENACDNISEAIGYIEDIIYNDDRLNICGNINEIMICINSATY